jgi:hypothetical protein
MFHFFGIVFLVLGVVLLGYAIVAVIRGRFTKSPRRVKFDPKWRPARLVHRDDEPGQFWLEVIRYALIAGICIAVAINWLRK